MQVVKQDTSVAVELQVFLFLKYTVFMLFACTKLHISLIVIFKIASCSPLALELDLWPRSTLCIILF